MNNVNKISYRKIHDLNGTVYNQRIKISFSTYLFLQQKVEEKINFPNYEDNFCLSGKAINLKSLEHDDNNCCFMNLTTTKFINEFLKLPLLNRNTYLFIQNF